MYPFERFTERAKKVLTLAQQEAEGAGHTYINTEHLLLGLLQDADSLGARVLVGLGVDLARAREAVDAALSREEDGGPVTRIVPTAQVKRVIEMAFEEARRMGHAYVGTEHLLLGMIIEGEGVAARVLQDLGITLDASRAAIARLLEALEAGRGEEPAPARRPSETRSLSPRVRSILARAHTLAAESGASELGVEHLEQAIAEWRAQQQ